MSRNTTKATILSTPPVKTALQYSLIYAIAAVAWIVASDQVVLQVAATDMDISQLQTYKGMSFVLLTTMLLFGLIYRQLRRIYISREQLKELEKKLKAEQTHYALLSEQSGLGVGLYDSDGHLQFLNKVALDRLGGTLPDYIGKHVSDIFDDDTTRLVLERFSALRSELSPQVYVDQVSLGNGERWFRSYYSVIRSEQNKGESLQIVSDDITEQMEAERKRQELLTQLELAVDTADMGIWSLHVRTGELYRNKQILRIYGLSEENPGSLEEWQAQVHPEDRGYADKSVSQAVDHGNISKTVFRIIRPDGEIRYISATARPLHENGELVKIFGINVDVTETVENEKRLQESEQKYRHLVETSFDLIWSIDSESRFSFVNQASRHIFGREPEEMIGHLYTDFISPDQLAIMDTFEDFVQKQDRVGDFQNWIVRKDGNQVLLSSNAIMLHDEKGQVYGTTGVSRDITQQKAREKQFLLQSQLLQAVQQAVIATDLEGHVVYWNDFAEQMYGWQASEVEGRLISEITVLDASQAEAEQIMSQIRETGSWSGEFSVRRKDGHVFPAFVVNSRFYDENGDPAGIIGLSIDISERKKQQTALQAAKDHLNAMFEASPAAIVVIDYDGVVKHWNPAAEDLFGWTAEEVMDQRIPVIPDNKLDEFGRNLDRLKSTGGETDLHVVRKRKDGTLIDLSLSTTHFDGPDEKTLFMAVYVDISDRLKLTRELESTKNLLERIFASLTEVVFVIDAKDRTIVSCNSAIEDMFGYSPAEVIGKNTAFLHTSPNAYYQFGIVGDRILEEQGAFSTEYQMRHKDGTILETAHVVKTLKPGAGLQGGAVSVIRDITQEKTTLRQLRHNEQRYRELFENAPVAIWQQDFSEMKQYLQALGFTEKDELKHYLQTHPTALEECLRLAALQESNLTALSLYEAEDTQQFIDYLEVTLSLEDENTKSAQIDSMLAIASNQHQFEGEFVNWTFKGKRLVMLIRWIVLPGSEETYENVLVIGLDITASKQLELRLRNGLRQQKELTTQAKMLQKSAEALVHSTQLHDGLQESEKNLAAITNYSDLAVFQIEKDRLVPVISNKRTATGPRLLYNEIQYEQYPALHAALTIGHPVRLRIIEDDQPLRSAFKLDENLMDWIAIPLSSRDVTLGLLCVSNQDQTFSEKDLEILTTFSYQVASALDNSRVHLELQKSYERLENIQQKTIQAARLAAIGELAAGVAHQINNPLMTVIADSHLLLKHIGQDDPTRESAEAISRAAHRAGDIVQRLLDFARALPNQMVMLNVNHSLAQAIDLIRPQIEPRYAQIHIRFSDDIPPIYGSEEHLQDVWMNLLLNARDAVREVQSGIVRVSTAYSEEIKQVIVTIEDTGVGMDEHIIDNIFDPFFTTKQHGTGLGLSICFDIVQQHHGTIEVEKISSGGTRFVVKLPIK